MGLIPVYSISARADGWAWPIYRYVVERSVQNKCMIYYLVSHRLIGPLLSCINNLLYKKKWASHIHPIAKEASGITISIPLESEGPSFLLVPVEHYSLQPLILCIGQKAIDIIIIEVESTNTIRVTMEMNGQTIVTTFVQTNLQDPHTRQHIRQAVAARLECCHTFPNLREF